MTMRNMLMKALAGAAFIVSLAASSPAQSAFSDAKGESSVSIREGGGFARINATDKSIELGFLRDRGDERLYFGLDLKGKSSGDFASLFNGGTPSTEAEVGLTVGKRFLLAPSDISIVNRCQVRVQGELLTTRFPEVVKLSREEFINNFKKTRLPEVQEKLVRELREVLIKEAVAKGMTEAGAKLAAEAVGAKVFEDEVARIVEKEANAAADAQTAAIEARARTMVREVTPGFCLEEDPALERRAVDWLSLRVGYKRARYKLLNETAATFADQIRKQNFDGLSATLSYNTLITLDNLDVLRKARRALTQARTSTEQRRRATQESRPGESKGSMIVGFSIGVRRKNNTDDLDSVEIEDQSFASSNETTQRRSVSKQTVLSGDYKEFISVPFNTDVVWYPGLLRSRIAIDFFTRSDLSKTGREFVPGVGLFITKEGKPTKVVGGISFALDDGKGRVGLVGGFHF